MNDKEIQYQRHLQQKLGEYIVSYPEYKVKCKSSQSRAKEIEDAETINHVSIDHESKVISIYYWE